MSDVQMSQSAFDTLMNRILIAENRATKAETELKEVREAAELSEFIELAREKIQGNEDDWSEGFTDDAYVNAIRAAYPNETFPKELKKISRHYRRWIWILMRGDQEASPQIQRLRNLLNNNRTAYHKFAKSMQSFYGLLSKNVHVSSFKIKYLRKEKLDHYLKYVGDDIREDISALLRSESKSVRPTSS